MERGPEDPGFSACRIERAGGGVGIQGSRKLSFHRGSLGDGGFLFLPGKNVLIRVAVSARALKKTLVFQERL